MGILRSVLKFSDNVERRSGKQGMISEGYIEGMAGRVIDIIY